MYIFQLLHQKNSEWEEVRKEMVLQSFLWSQSNVSQVPYTNNMLPGMLLSFSLLTTTTSPTLLSDGTGAHLPPQCDGLETKNSGDLIIFFFFSVTYTCALGHSGDRRSPVSGQGKGWGHVVGYKEQDKLARDRGPLDLKPPVSVHTDIRSGSTVPADGEHCPRTFMLA